MEAARQMRTAAASLAVIGLIAAALCGYPMITGHLPQDVPHMADAVRGYESLFDALHAMCWPGTVHDGAAVQYSFGWCEFRILDAMLSP